MGSGVAHLALEAEVIVTPAKVPVERVGVVGRLGDVAHSLGWDRLELSCDGLGWCRDRGQAGQARAAGPNRGPG